MTTFLAGGRAARHECRRRIARCDRRRCNGRGRCRIGRRGRARGSARGKAGKAGFEIRICVSGHEAQSSWQFHTPLSSSCGCLQFGGIGGMGFPAGQSLGTPGGRVVVVTGATVVVVGGSCGSDTPLVGALVAWAGGRAGAFRTVVGFCSGRRRCTSALPPPEPPDFSLDFEPGDEATGATAIRAGGTATGVDFALARRAAEVVGVSTTNLSYTFRVLRTTSVDCPPARLCDSAANCTSFPPPKPRSDVPPTAAAATAVLPSTQVTAAASAKAF